MQLEPCVFPCPYLMRRRWPLRRDLTILPAETQAYSAHLIAPLRSDSCSLDGLFCSLTSICGIRHSTSTKQQGWKFSVASGGGRRRRKGGETDTVRGSKSLSSSSECLPALGCHAKLAVQDLSSPWDAIQLHGLILQPSFQSIPNDFPREV